MRNELNRVFSVNHDQFPSALDFRRLSERLGEGGQAGARILELKCCVVDGGSIAFLDMKILEKQI